MLPEGTYVLRTYISGDVVFVGEIDLVFVSLLVGSLCVCCLLDTLRSVDRWRFNDSEQGKISRVVWSLVLYVSVDMRIQGLRTRAQLPTPTPTPGLPAVKIEQTVRVGRRLACIKIRPLLFPESKQ